MVANYQNQGLLMYVSKPEFAHSLYSRGPLHSAISDLGLADFKIDATYQGCL
jgi:hypothetical protein